MKIRKEYIYTSFVILIIILIFIIVTLINHKSLTCTLNKDLIEGISEEEILKISLVRNKVKKVNVNKTITLDSYYDSTDTYTTSINQILQIGYKYVTDNINTTKDGNKINLNINIKNDGVIPDNLEILINGDEKSTLRYNIKTTFDDDSIKFDTKYTLSELKEKLENYNYTCK